MFYIGLLWNRHKNGLFIWDVACSVAHFYSKMGILCWQIHYLLFFYRRSALFAFIALPTPKHTQNSNCEGLTRQLVTISARTSVASRFELPHETKPSYYSYWNCVGFYVRFTRFWKQGDLQNVFQIDCSESEATFWCQLNETKLDILVRTGIV